MIYLDLGITKPYWSEILHFVSREINEGSFVRLKTQSKYPIVKLTIGKKYLVYVAVLKVNNDFVPIGWLYLYRKPGWASWEVAQTFVFKDLRGAGIGQSLYKAAINTDKIILASGKKQTKMARSLWEKFIREKTFNISAVDFKNVNSTSHVWWEDDHIQCDFELYKKFTQRQSKDIRFIAIRNQK